MTVLNAVLLGVIQAAGEFLPVSSSAHLVIFSFFCGGQYQGLAFDVALHLATLLAVLGYFRRDMLALAKAGFCAPKSADGRLFWYIGIASIPAAVCGCFLGAAAEHTFRSPPLIAALLIIFGALLMFADRRSRAAVNKRGVFTLGAMLLIGCAQALALAPGVSRSGITITAALLLGYGRAQSARLSFFLSVPVIAGAAVLKLKDFALSDVNAPLAFGFLAALICGFAVIKFFIKYIQTRSFDIFIYYRWLLGAAIIAVYCWRV